MLVEAEVLVILLTLVSLLVAVYGLEPLLGLFLVVFEAFPCMFKPVCGLPVAIFSISS